MADKGVIERNFDIKAVYEEARAPPEEGRIAIELRPVGKELDDIFLITILRMTIRDFEALGRPTAGDRIKVSVERA